MMESITQPWADTPFPLLPTPGRGQDISKLPPHLHIAREMACAHNGLIRSLNSIYQQSPFVSSPTDIKDLLTYTTFWCSWIHEHHEGEEMLFFPAIEEITGIKGLMEKNVEQHHAFMTGLEELGKCVKEMKVEEYDWGKLRGIIDRFGGKLTAHLSEEIDTLLGLEKYDGVGIELKKAYMVFDTAMQQGEKTILYPIVLGATDVGYEGGTHWPEIPGFVKTLVHYWYERKYQGVWRFSPCTTWGERRPLMFTL